MDTELQKKLAYELTMEYIRQNETIKYQGLEPKDVFNKFNSIYNSIYDSMRGKRL